MPSEGTRVNRDGLPTWDPSFAQIHSLGLPFAKSPSSFVVVLRPRFPGANSAIAGENSTSPLHRSGPPSASGSDGLCLVDGVKQLAETAEVPAVRARHQSRHVGELGFILFLLQGTTGPEGSSLQ